MTLVGQQVLALLARRFVTQVANEQFGERRIERFRVVDEDFLRALGLDLLHKGFGTRFAGKRLLQLR